MAASKKSKLDEIQFLSILEKVLPKATRDTKLAHAIYEGVANEIRVTTKLAALETFCEKSSLPDLEPATITEFQTDLVASFGEDNVSITPDEENGTLEVEITLPDRLVATAVKILPMEEEEKVVAPFVPFPVALPADPELVWLLARREDFGPDEAARALVSIEEEFWATKAGQKLLKSGCERTFADFILNVPATALAESNLKRHYKAPETLKTLQQLPATKMAAVEV